jgi:hypothetical protein
MLAGVGRALLRLMPVSIVKIGMSRSGRNPVYKYALPARPLLPDTLLEGDAVLMHQSQGSLTMVVSPDHGLCTSNTHQSLHHVLFVFCQLVQLYASCLVAKCQSRQLITRCSRQLVSWAFFVYVAWSMLLFGPVLRADCQASKT